MRPTKALLITLAFAYVPADACAQGTKDPSNPVPTVVYPIRPLDEPAPPTAVPNVYRVQPVVPRLRRVYPTNPPPK